MTVKLRHLLLAGAGLLLAPAAARAHAVHTAAVEMELNRETGRLEVSLRLFLDDLEAALTARAGKPIRADRIPAREFAVLTSAYVAETVVLMDAAGNRAKLEWIGRDLKDAANEAWLFVQFTAPAKLEGSRLRITLLRDQFADQLTSVQVRDGEHRLTLLFPPGETERRVTWSP